MPLQSSNPNTSGDGVRLPLEPIIHVVYLEFGQYLRGASEGES